MDRIAFLQRVDLCSEMSPDTLERLADRLLESSFDKGERIVARGEPGESMFLLVQGEVRVPISDPDGNLLFEAHLVPGQFFGEMALLTGEPRSADVVAATDCHCLVFRKEEVDRLVQRHPEVAQILTRILGERLLKSGILRQVGKYRILDELGRGGMAIVYDAFHPGIERTVAIKMLSHELASRPLFRERFQNEARLIGRLRHPNIVEVYDTEQAYATFFIVMERIEGVSLEDMVEKEGPLPPAQVREILRQLCLALLEAHRNGVVHRDLKPANVLVTPEGVVKLMDFGLALDAREASLEHAEGAGTPMYMAPEQVTGSPVDARTDIYALGLVAYQMLVGSPPFEGTLFKVLQSQQYDLVPSPRDMQPGTPEDLDALVLRASQKIPEDRYQDCQEILDLLGESEELDLTEIRLATLSFLFSPSKAKLVEELVEEIKERVDGLSGIEIR